MTDFVRQPPAALRAFIDVLREVPPWADLHRHTAKRTSLTVLCYDHTYAHDNAHRSY